jgi:hypothetical protein
MALAQQIVEASVRIAQGCLSYRPISGSDVSSIPLRSSESDGELATTRKRHHDMLICDATNGETTNLGGESSSTTTDESEQSVQRLQLEYMFLKRVYREYIAKLCREAIPSKLLKNDRFGKKDQPMTDNHKTNRGQSNADGTKEDATNEEAQINQGLSVVRRQALSDVSDQVTQALVLYAQWDAAIYKPARAALLSTAIHTHRRSGQNCTLESNVGQLARTAHHLNAPTTAAAAVAAEPRNNGRHDNDDSNRKRQERLLARENVLLKGILADLVATHVPLHPLQLHW